MLDIKYIIDNKNEIEKNIKIRNVAVDIDEVIGLYEKRIGIQGKLDEKRQRRNELAKLMKSKMEDTKRKELIMEGKELRIDIAELEDEIRIVDRHYIKEAFKIPNLTHPDTPVGGEEDSLEIKKCGNIREFDFKPLDHVELGTSLDIVDFDSGAEVCGQKFYYLKNEGAMLELALVQYGMKFLTERGFTPYITPDLAKVNILEGIGFNPRGEESNVYTLEDLDMALVATAEITLGGINQNKMLDPEDLPIKMVGFSHCFRREAGAAGKATKGLYRVHQFSKVEMFILTHPDKSEEQLEELRQIEEDLYTSLGIPYRVLDIATGDLGNQAYRKYDLEAWMPGRGGYGEITSTSNCTDFQSRRLNTRCKDKNGNKYFAHMLNGTVVAVPRVIIAILENFQNADGSVDIPEVLRPYMGIDRIKR